MNIDDALTSLESNPFSESLTSAQQLYQQALFRDMIRASLGRKSKHNDARALATRARIAKRKAKRKS